MRNVSATSGPAGGVAYAAYLSELRGDCANIIHTDVGGTSFDVSLVRADRVPWTRETWIAALDANMLSAIELIKATVDPMIARRFGRKKNERKSEFKKKKKKEEGKQDRTSTQGWGS